jgi:hypothetical protein
VYDRSLLHHLLLLCSRNLTNECSFVSALVAPAEIFSKQLSTKVLVCQGEIFYSIHVWHLVVWILSRRSLGVVLHVQVVPRLWLIALGLLLTLAVSSLSYHFVEEPSREAIRKLRWVRWAASERLNYNLLIANVLSSHRRGLHENLPPFCGYCDEAALRPHAEVR